MDLEKGESDSTEGSDAYNPTHDDKRLRWTSEEHELFLKGLAKWLVVCSRGSP